MIQSRLIMTYPSLAVAKLNLITTLLRLILTKSRQSLTQLSLDIPLEVLSPSLVPDIVLPSFWTSSSI